MVKITTLCTDCVQVITNPICPNCFAREVVMWLRDKDLPEKKLKLMKKYLRALAREAETIPSDIRCILCGSKRVNLCIYCFTSPIEC